MPSKQVTDKEKSARHVSSTANTQGDQAAAAVEDVLSRYLASGEKMPDLKLLFGLVSRGIDATAQAMTLADQKHESELGDDQGPRDARDTAADEVGAVLADLRDGLSTGYGRATVGLFGLGGTLPTDPSVVGALGSSVLARLESGDVQLPPARRKKALTVNLEEFAKELKEQLPALQTALADVKREEAEAAATLHAKRAASTEYDAAFTRGATFLSAAFALGGLDDLATKVRPSRRRPGRTEEPVEEPPAGGGAATPEP